MSKITYASEPKQFGRRLIIGHGECFLCPMCQDPIGFALVDIYSGELVRAEIFKAIPPQPEFRNGQRALTHCCKEPFITHDDKRGAMIYTKQGWV